ncbi:endonuclease [Streptomyces sp. bgisy100]|uniref:endonuclease n=1 Tax=Streptomyces sp. bgisy100 TaxID=3413783 RepID=UPI003D7572FC
MITAQRPAQAQSDHLSRVEETRRRYDDRATERERSREALDRRGVLYADTPERVNKRLARLGVDWSLASALDRTPARATTGSSLPLEPESFGADVLGLERLMGRNDLIEVRFLQAGYLAGRSIGRVTVRGREAHHGTGFMVSPSLLMTNNHVLRTAEEASRGIIAFNFEAGVTGRPLAPVTFDLEPERFFVTDRALDFSLVAVAGRGPDGVPLDSFGHLRLSEAQGMVILGELVNIIQHPNGEPKQLALRENQVVDLLEMFVHYDTDTAPGSSGSPVFNDQWEVVALHHSGVPRTDTAGNLLAVDGTRWTPEMGEQRLAWKANEGVRISRVLDALRQFPLSTAAAELREQVFAANGGPLPEEGAPSPSTRPPAAATASTAHGTDGSAGNGKAPSAPQATAAGPAVGAAPGTAPVTAGGVTQWTVPLRISVGVGPSAPGISVAPGPVPPAAAAAPAAGPPVGATPAAPPVELNGHRPADQDVHAALVNLEAGRTRPYYEAEEDRAAREAYYADIRTTSAAGLLRALARLLESTHERRPAYKPMRMVYPWVDLHSDLRLRSIYSGKSFSPEEFIRADAAAEDARIGRWEEFLRRESAPDPSALGAELDALEAALPFNCEHVVPQSWFGKDEPMRGDLHHLFACESGCNSFRGNIPYFDFPDREEAVRNDCGRRETKKFEPSAGKGTVARATLYFLLRYPKLIGDAEGEFPQERLDLLLAWHAEDPVSDYERHRNAAIFEIQGNRNPLIDNPRWAEEIDFSTAWP